MVLPLDGSPVTVKDKTTASASLDAGWLAITTRVIAPMNRGATNVHRDVYIVSHGDSHGLAELHYRMARWLPEQHRLQLPGSDCVSPTEVTSEGGKSK